MKDNCLTRIDELIEEVVKENIRQLHRWGIQDETLPCWIMWLTEEVGELAQAAGDYHRGVGHPKRIFEEAIQAATLCLKIAEAYMK